jgi:hypothetical protein
VRDGVCLRSGSVLDCQKECVGCTIRNVYFLLLDVSGHCYDSCTSWAFCIDTILATDLHCWRGVFRWLHCRRLAGMTKSIYEHARIFENLVLEVDDACAEWYV